MGEAPVTVEPRAPEALVLGERLLQRHVNLPCPGDPGEARRRPWLHWEAVSGTDAIHAFLLARDDVRLAYVFGSGARGELRPGSDLDVAVLFAREPALEALDRLSFDLSEAAGRTVDLVLLGTAPPLLAHEVVSTGRLLVCRDEEERVAFETRTAARYLDTARLRRVQDDYLRAHAEAFRARPR